MQSIAARLYSLFAILLFIAAECLRLVMLLYNLDGAAGYVYYCIVALGILFVFLNSFKAKKYANAFVFKNNFHLNIFSYIASLGFFTDFVHQCVKIFFSVEDGSYKELTFFIPICFVCFFALISCFYFYTVGLSFGDKNYDFRELRFMHLSPLIWAVAQLFTVMPQAISFSNDIDSVIKYIMIALSACFFYRFAAEIDNESGAKPSTVFFADVFSYFGIIFLINRIMLFVSDKAEIGNSDGVLSVSVILICAFVFFFEKNICFKN